MAEKIEATSGLVDLINTNLGIKVFGLQIGGFTTTAKGTVMERAGAESLVLAMVHGVSVANACIKPPKPFLLLLPETGVDPDGECGFKTPLKKWLLPHTFSTLRLDTTAGDLHSLVTPLADVNGGIQFSNPRFQNGQACVTVHVWAKIDNSFPPIHVGFDTTKDVCISLDQCYTIIDIGVGKAQVCFRPPNQVCAEVSIGVGPISKTWSQCVTIPIPHTHQSSEAGCECTK